jgi:uncharacterized protein (DUF2147 family)
LSFLPLATAAGGAMTAFGVRPALVELCKLREVHHLNVICRKRQGGRKVNTIRTSLVFAGLLAGAVPAVAAVPATLPTGMWLDQSGRAGITIAPCGAKLCGTITWLKAPLDAQGRPKTDSHNTDSALRGRPMCGLPLMGDFVADGTDAWSGGYVYDPVGGKTYSANMHVQPDGSLAIRGYVGISLFGRSTTWTRPAQPLPHC